MSPHDRPPVAAARTLCLSLLMLGVLGGLASAEGRATKDLPPVFDKPLPEGVQDLKAIQTQVKKVVDQVLPCTVGLQIGQAQGSGVIINADGYVLTAAHVSGQPGRKVRIILHDGRLLHGVTLGADQGMDSGLVKITDPGADFPYVDTGHSAGLKKGQWVIAIGHPGGYQPGRPPVVRVGRILETNGKLVRSDCTLVGGDSGGPLFDMTGKVVGIHSRIGGHITYNIHVPVDTFVTTWEKLAASEVWGSPLNMLAFGKQGQEPFLGVRADPNSRQLLRIVGVTPDSPAEKAGLRAEDVILRIDDHDVRSIADLDAILHTKLPGHRITMEVRRGDAQMTLTITLGKRPAG